MARVKDMSEAQKAIIDELWEAEKTKRLDTLSVSHLEDNRMNLFKAVQLCF